MRASAPRPTAATCCSISAVASQVSEEREAAVVVVGTAAVNPVQRRCFARGRIETPAQRNGAASDDDDDDDADNGGDQDDGGMNCGDG